MSWRRRALSLLGLVAVLVTLALGLGVRLLAPPEIAAGPSDDPAAGLRAQERLVELLLRSGGLSARTEPVVLGWDELNALLARHVESRHLPLRPIVVRPDAGTGLQLAGRTSLRELGPTSPIQWLWPLLPDMLLDRDLWLSVWGRLEVRPAVGEFVVERAAIGRQRVPTALLWDLLEVDPRDQLAWRMPRVVERLETRPDRLVIYTRPRGG